MRHGKATKHFGRDKSERRSLLRNQTTDLLRHGKLVTTQAKALQVRRLAEEMITLGKHQSLHHRRQAGAYILDPDVVKKVFTELAPRYKDRPGGYTRMMKLGPRKGDNAAIVQLELV